MRAPRKIVTSPTHSPLPVRGHDFCAHYDGEEEAGNYGYGATEQDAIDDFKANCAEGHDERLGEVAVSNPFGARRFVALKASDPHQPSYVLADQGTGDGPLIAINHHADHQIDDARAQWIAHALNAAIAKAAAL